MYELMYLGLQPLVIAHNAHQANFASTAAAKGACRYFGVGDGVDWPGLARAIQGLYRAPPVAGARLIDGGGVERLAGRIMELCG
jgi:hypothetical protein